MPLPPLFSFLSRPVLARRRRLARGMVAELGHIHEAQGWQLERLNEVWGKARQRIPFYRQLSQTLSLPDRFDSLEQFSALVPALTKEDLQRNGPSCFDPGNQESLLWASTGGSTGEPVRFPRYRSELLVHEELDWYFHGLIGWFPEDPYVRLWGHSHGLGRGLGRRLRVMNRNLKDRILGITRISAYHLSPGRIEEGVARIARSSVGFLVGYSKALEAYADWLLAQEEAVAFPSLKLIVATAEGFAAEEERQRVEKAFGVPVLMEYGMMETGPLAHEVTAGRYQVAWNRYFLECQETSTGQQKLLVTALYPRAFPLFRYDTGDLLEGMDRSAGIQTFQRVVGRSFPNFVTPTGETLHSVLFDHCLRGTPGIRKLQVGLEGVRIEKIFLIVDRKTFSAEMIPGIRQRLKQVHRSLEDLPLDTVDEPILTPAGKQPVFLQIKKGG